MINDKKNFRWSLNMNLRMSEVYQRKGVIVIEIKLEGKQLQWIVPEQNLTIFVSSTLHTI